MTCPMPNITPEMIQWWFWWHPQKDERYQIWFPGEHFAISYAKKDKDYFEQEELPAFQNNTQYPVERIGGMKMPLRIDFGTHRVWIGEKLKNPLLRKLILTDETAKGMAEHCYTEYRNLVKILPELYQFTLLHH